MKRLLTHVVLLSLGSAGILACGNNPPVRGNPPASTEQSLLDRAHEAHLRGDHATAVMLYQNYVRNYPESPETARVHYFSGKSHLVLGKLREGVADLDAALRKSVPETVVPHADLMLQIGVWSLRAGDWSRGRTVLEKLQQEFPNSAEAASARAKLALADNKYYVQLGSFKDRIHAERGATGFKSQGIDAHVKSAELVSGQTTYWVLTGGYFTWAEAVREADRLRGLGIDAVAVP